MIKTTILKKPGAKRRVEMILKTILKPGAKRRVKMILKISLLSMSFGCGSRILSRIRKTWQCQCFAPKLAAELTMIVVAIITDAKSWISQKLARQIASDKTSKIWQLCVSFSLKYCKFWKHQIQSAYRLIAANVRKKRFGSVVDFGNNWVNHSDCIILYYT